MKPFTVVDVEQGSEDWLQARCGLLTGSRAPAMLATVKDKGKESAKRRDLRLALVCERLTGRPVEAGWVSNDMKRGRELEPAAVRAYEARMGVFVKRAGFLRHPSLPIGCSLDAYVGDFAGILECKAPRSATHLEYLRGGGVPPDYVGQVWHNLFVSGAEYCDFVSYDPRFPPDLQLFRVRVQRTDWDMAVYQRTVLAFLEEVDRELAEVRALVVAA